MKIVREIPSYFLALVFLVFGLNGFLNFILLPPPEGDSATFFGVLFTTGYLKVVKVIEIICAILLVIPKTRALGLVLLMPIIVNIYLFEVLIAKTSGLSILWLIVGVVGLYFYREKYSAILSK